MIEDTLCPKTLSRNKKKKEAKTSKREDNEASIRSCYAAKA